MNEKIKILKIKKMAKLPTRATEGSAGLDLYACIDAPVEIIFGKPVLIPTGIAIALPSKKYGAFIYARSGLGTKYGICLSNGVGVIDSDYRGELFVGLCNISSTPYTVKPNDRIAQLLVMPICLLDFEQVDSLDSTLRGSGGFGSTGKI